MSQTITLYVDGACRGNPGLGGWGAYVITEQGEHKLLAVNLIRPQPYGTYCCH